MKTVSLRYPQHVLCLDEQLLVTVLVMNTFLRLGERGFVMSEIGQQRSYNISCFIVETVRTCILRMQVGKCHAFRVSITIVGFTCQVLIP